MAETTPEDPGDAPSFTPLYEQVRARLVERLAAGEWSPGEAIPSEQALAARFNVAQGTVRKAIDALASDNLLVRRQGKGTFVATHAEEAVSRFRFLSLRRDDGVDEYPDSRLVEVRRARAGAALSRALELKPGDGIIVIRRVLSWSARPVIVDDIHLPACLFPGFSRERVEAHAGSMYGFFETFGVRMLEARERIKAVAAKAAAADLLGLPAGSPLLEIERVAFTFGARPVELRRSLCSTAAHHYAARLR